MHVKLEGGLDRLSIDISSSNVKGRWFVSDRMAFISLPCIDRYVGQNAGSRDGWICAWRTSALFVNVSTNRVVWYRRHGSSVSCSI